MKNKVLLFFVLVVLCYSSAWAQIQIKGTVVSENDSEPMIGVAILEEELRTESLQIWMEISIFR